MQSRFDVLTLGAGIVGVATALQLQRRGRRVALVDCQAPGGATSFGNAGIIQTEAIIPYTFPQTLGPLLSYALGLKNEANYHLGAVLSLLPNLARYWRAGRPEMVARTIAANKPLFAHCLSEHQLLADEAGIGDILIPGGWIKIFRSDKSLAAGQVSLAFEQAHGVVAGLCDATEIRALEPSLNGPIAGGVHYPEPWHVRDPVHLIKGYVDRFVALGGVLIKGDALSLRHLPTGWSVDTETQAVTGDNVVAALGPWSSDLFDRLGYNIPMFFKRGYHMHFERPVGELLGRPVMDADNGYVLSPMRAGIRMATGAEFALRDAQPTPVQLEQAEPKARSLTPLGKRLDPKPWLGSRPCLPDMLPIIGPAPRHSRLWFACGHAHHGLTLAAVTGRLIAEMVTGATPMIDPTPYAMARFATS